MKKYLQSEIFRKMFFALLTMALAPALALGWLAVQTGMQAGDLSTSLSRSALDAKSQEMLELRAVETAQAIASFLEERETDLETLALLTPSEDAYLSFVEEHCGEIWGVEEGHEYRMQEPFYVEVAWIDEGGWEALKIADGMIVPQTELSHIDQAGVSRYPSTDWFSETIQLGQDEIYVGHLTGYFLSRESYENGERFDGIIRFAKPVYGDSGVLLGVVTLAMDYRHLAQFSAHIVPDATRFAAEPDVSTGSYAYLIDDRGWTLVHPNQFYQVGAGAGGENLPFVTEVGQIGSLPIRLDKLGFIDKNLASIPGLAASGEPGSLQYTWQEKEKFVAFAPIPYYGGGYHEPAGFGWIGIGAEVGDFHQAANQVGAAIDERVNSLIWVTLIVALIGGLATMPVAARLAHSVASPVQRIIQAAQSVEKGENDLEVLEPLLQKKSEGEMVTLARVFQRMTEQVYLREQQLKETISELRIEINEARKSQEVADVVETEYFQVLQSRVKEMKRKKNEEED
jgi:hypothetical protein